MKKKLLGVVFFVLAASFASSGFSAGGTGIIGGIVLALVFVLLALKQFNALNFLSRGKSSNSGPIVLTVAGSNKYHRNRNCQHIKGKGTIGLHRSMAKEKGFTPCKSCYPRGD